MVGVGRRLGRSAAFGEFDMAGSSSDLPTPPDRGTDVPPYPTQAKTRNPERLQGAKNMHLFMPTCMPHLFDDTLPVRFMDTFLII